MTNVVFLAHRNDLTKDEVVKMAREAGAVFDPQWGIASNIGTATFERFAALCRAPLVAEVERLKKDLSTVDVILEECKMDWSGDVTQIKAEHAHELLALQADRDDWKARAEAAEEELARVRTVEPFGWYSAKEDDFMLDKIRKTHERLNSHTHRIGKYDTALFTAPQPAAQEPTSAVTANAKPEKAKPYAWRNPMNGVVISNDKKERLLCVGAGYPNFSEPLYAAGRQFIKENGK